MKFACLYTRMYSIYIYIYASPFRHCCHHEFYHIVIYKLGGNLLNRPMEEVHDTFFVVVSEEVSTEPHFTIGLHRDEGISDYPSLATRKVNACHRR